MQSIGDNSAVDETSYSTVRENAGGNGTAISVRRAAEVWSSWRFVVFFTLKLLARPRVRAF